MHQHPRSSPKPGSPANIPRANPTRLSNPREHDAEGSRTSSDRGTTSEQEFNMGEVSDAIMRGQEGASHGKEQLAKLGQVIQVCLYMVHCYRLLRSDRCVSGTELFHQGRLDNPSFKSCLATGLFKRFEGQENQ